MKKTESIANLAKAVSVVQGKLTYAKKDSKNPFFKSNYADLESVWLACRDLLAENGLSVIQFPGDCRVNDVPDEGSVVFMSLTTILAHESGEWIEQEMSVPVSKVDAQGAGSALTYMRRYALAAVVGVVQADDDGNAASAKDAKKDNMLLAEGCIKLQAIDNLDDLRNVFGKYFKELQNNKTARDQLTEVYQGQKDKLNATSGQPT